MARTAALYCSSNISQVLEGCCPGGVCLQFVGPEVPSELHGTTARAGEGPGGGGLRATGAEAGGVEMTYWKAGALSSSRTSSFSPMPLPRPCRSLPHSLSDEQQRNNTLSVRVPSSPTQGEYGRLVNLVLKGGAAAGPSSAAEQAPGGRNKAGKAAAAKGPSPSNLPPPPPAALLRLPDVFVGFNMGLTCPEYSGWGHTLRAIKRCDLSRGWS